MCPIPIPSRDYYAAAQKDSKTTAGTTNVEKEGADMGAAYNNACGREKPGRTQSTAGVAMRFSRGVFLPFHFQGVL